MKYQLAPKVVSNAETVNSKAHRHIPFKLNAVSHGLAYTFLAFSLGSMAPAFAQNNGTAGSGSTAGLGGVGVSGSGSGGNGGSSLSSAGGGGGAGGTSGSGGSGGYSSSKSPSGGNGGAVGDTGLVISGNSTGYDGSVSVVSKTPGGGGGGGGIGFWVSGSSSLDNSFNVTGGKGGIGGSGGTVVAGGGGSGAAGIGGSSFILNNSGVITGGTGGSGGIGGSGGSGGSGGAGIAGGNFTLNNSGAILGGFGGAGGSGIEGTDGAGGSGGAGINVLSGSGVTLINSASGTIVGGNAAIGGTSGSGVQVDSGSSITTLTNNGSIVGGTGAVGILNNGTISTLNNRQGASSSALTFSGNLPSAYNIIVRSPTDFGKLAVTSATGNMTFGIYNTSTLAVGRYLAVLTGVNAANLNGSFTNQTYGAYRWSLVETAGTTWELDVAPNGPTTADTQASLQNTAQVLQGTFTLQNAVLANSLSYDCNVFGANGICISAGGRNTAVSAANGLNNTSALLITAYRPHPSYRIGAYADQNLSVSNPGGTVNLGNNTPLIGLFGAWNERLDGTGTEVKVSAAYGQKNTTVNRQVVGTSEPGSGSSQLNSQGAQVVAKYGFAVTDKAMVSPYVGMRYTQNNMGGYTEGTSPTVIAPLTYSALNTNATTALAGVGASYKVIPTVTAFAIAGIESDTNTANGSYSGTSSSISGLTPVNFNAYPVKTRPTATLGAYYDVAKNQRLGLTGIYRQESYQAVQTTTVLATYTIGL